MSEDERKIRILAAKRKYREAHREEIRAKERARYYANIEKSRERARVRAAKWLSIHREESWEKRKLNLRNWYRRRNKNREFMDSRSALSRKWGHNNKHKKRESAARRRARKGRFSSLHEKRFVIAFYETAERISRCTGVPHEVDHVFPLARGGTHTPDNLQVIPAIINRRKHTKLVGVDHV